MIVDVEKVHSKPQVILKQLLGQHVLSKKQRIVSSVNNSFYNPIQGA